MFLNSTTLMKIVDLMAANNSDISTENPLPNYDYLIPIGFACFIGCIALCNISEPTGISHKQYDNLE